MMNHLWVWLIILGILFGLYMATENAIQAQTLEERFEAVKKVGADITDVIVKRSMLAVTISLELIGLMALWLGIMKLAEDSGLVTFLARLVRPIVHFLFPGIPREHPAVGAMLMNISANMLGLDNAATPLGLKAMKELQTLSEDKDTATDDMIMFLAINTSSVTLIPFTIMALRASTGSANPQIILGPALLATTCSTIGGISAVLLLRKISRKKQKGVSQ